MSLSEQSYVERQLVLRRTGVLEILSTVLSSKSNSSSTLVEHTTCMMKILSVEVI